MRVLSYFTRYFKQSPLSKNLRNNFARFQQRSQIKFHGYALLTSLTLGTLALKYNNFVYCEDESETFATKIGLATNRLLYIKKKDGQDQDIEQLIESLRRNGVEVTEVNLEESSDQLTSELQPKDLNFIAVNQDGDILEIPNGDDQAKLRLMSFFKSIHEIEKANLEGFYDLVERIKEHERIIFAYIPEQEDYKVGPFNEYDTYNKSKTKDVRDLWNKYRQLKNSHISYASSFFIIKDPKVAQAFQIGQDDIGEIYTVKKSSIYNNFETSTRMRNQRVQISRLEITDEDLGLIKSGQELKDELLKRKLYENCLDHVNYFQTQNELDNLLQLQKQLGIKKVFIYYRSNNDQNFSKILTKLTKVKKEFKKDEFIILASNNLPILNKQFQMIHDGFTNTFRFIDYSRSWEWKPPKDYTAQIVRADHLDRKELLHDSEGEQSTSDLQFTVPYRSIFDEKPTRKRIKNYLQNVLEGKTDVYFESGPRVMTYFSKNLVGKRFEEDVLKDDSNVMIEFFKPTCPSCAALSVSYEDFARIISKIQEHISLAEDKNFNEKQLEHNFIQKYKIQNPEKFRNLKVFRYNIYNESPVFPSPASTPLIFLFKPNQKTKPLLIDLVDAKVNLTDNEKVIRHLIRLVDES